MATPIGHTLAGYTIFGFASASNRDRFGLMLLCIVMANAADLDFLPGILLGTPPFYHQGITHSLGFAFLASLGVAGVYSRRGFSFSTIFGLSFASYLSHLLLDFFGPDGRFPFGQPLLWPLSDAHFISPIQIFFGMQHGGSSHTSTLAWIKGILNVHNLSAIALEIALIVPFVTVAGWYERRRPENRR